MKWVLLFNLVLIALVAGDGAWQRNKMYKYKVRTSTLIGLKKQAIFRAHLYIYPQSEDRLIGQIKDAVYVEGQFSEKWDSDFNDEGLPYNQLPLNKFFEINLRNGVVDNLSVDREMTNEQINQLKFIVSQLQVDTNHIEEDEEDEEDDNNAFYNKKERTGLGYCDTTYDVTPIPDYLTENRDLIPLPEVGGEFIKIVKYRYHNNCTERNDEATRNEMDDYSFHSEENRIVISGSLKDYTIQSSFTTNKVATIDGQTSMPVNYVYLKLEQFEESHRLPQIESRNFLNVGNLIYKSNVYNNDRMLTASNQMDQENSRVRGREEPHRLSGEQPGIAGLIPVTPYASPDTVYTYGCLRNYCWAYCTVLLRYPSEWCWTRNGRNGNNYVKCTANSDCDRDWNCAGACALF